MEVYVNRELVGKYVGGYVGFEIDIILWVKVDIWNDIVVKVDNSYNL